MAQHIDAAGIGGDIATNRAGSAGAEIDLILRRGRRTLAFELKSSTVPRVSKGFWNALEDISPDEAYVVAPVEDSYPMKGDVMVSPLQEIIAKLQEE